MRTPMVWNKRKICFETRIYRTAHIFKVLVLILKIGGNNISNLSARPEKVACNISELIETFGKIECVLVGVVCEIFRRLRHRYISSFMYEERFKIYYTVMQSISLFKISIALCLDKRPIYCIYLVYSVLVSKFF